VGKTTNRSYGRQTVGLPVHRLATVATFPEVVFPMRLIAGGAILLTKKIRQTLTEQMQLFLESRQLASGVVQLFVSPQLFQSLAGKKHLGIAKIPEGTFEPVRTFFKVFVVTIGDRLSNCFRLVRALLKYGLDHTA
jgi:hypothetical protein